MTEASSTDLGRVLREAVERRAQLRSEWILLGGEAGRAQVARAMCAKGHVLGHVWNSHVGGLSVAAFSKRASLPTHTAIVDGKKWVIRKPEGRDVESLETVSAVLEGLPAVLHIVWVCQCGVVPMTASLRDIEARWGGAARRARDNHRAPYVTVDASGVTNWNARG